MRNGYAQLALLFDMPTRRRPAGALSVGFLTLDRMIGWLHAAPVTTERLFKIEEVVVEPDPDVNQYLLEGRDRGPRPGWRVQPDGPTCPSRELAEIAVEACSRLPEGWTLHYKVDPYGHMKPWWELFKRRRGGHLRWRTRSVSAEDLAKVVQWTINDARYTAAEEEAKRATAIQDTKDGLLTRKQPRTRDRRPTVYGPEPWRNDDNIEWSYWDLWFCVLCVADYGSDWAALDTAITQQRASVSSSYNGEDKWSHLLDLQKRLAEAGLTAADLAGDAATDRKTIAKARTKLIKQSPDRRHMTPAMRNPPSRQLEDQAQFGWWTQFPSSPREPYDQLAAAASFDLQASGWGRLATYDLTRPMGQCR